MAKIDEYVLVIRLDAAQESPTDKHAHKCGFDPFEPRLGCGRVFEHTNLCAGSEAAHTCPDCGRGPWEVVFKPPKLILP